MALPKPIFKESIDDEMVSLEETSGYLGPLVVCR